MSKKNDDPCNTYTEDQLTNFHNLLSELAVEAGEPGRDLTRCDAQIWNIFEPLTQGGMQIYLSYSDDELLEVVKGAAKRLGRMPNKDDVFCIYVRYLKRRFGNWPEVLQAADYQTAPDQPSEDEVKACMAQLSEEEMRHVFTILSARELPLHVPTQKGSKAAMKRLVPFFSSKEAVRMCIDILVRTEECENNILLSENIGPEYVLLLDELRALSHELGRTPLMMELPREKAYRLWRLFGSWNRVLKAAGIQPMKKKVYLAAYKSYMLSTATADFLRGRFAGKFTQNDYKNFDSLCVMARGLGRAPFKWEIPKNIFYRMNTIAGSWRVVMAEMGLIPSGPKRNGYKISTRK